jgi:hypothetical protein
MKQCSGWWLGVVVVGVVRSAAAACPPPGWDEAALEVLRAARFELADDARREALAEDLLDCLADPRPWLRDAIAFEALPTGCAPEFFRTHG